MLEDRIAVVTGAGQGIGLGVARALAAQGACVVIGELVPERGERAAAGMVAEGYRAGAIQLDVSRPESCSALVDAVLGEHGRIDILVNCAGIFTAHRSEEFPEEDWRRQIDVLLNGVFFTTQEVVRRAMIPQQSGSVVTVASIGGMGGWPMRAAYNAAKAGVIVLNEVLATEWARHGIRLNCVSPGVTRTEMIEKAIAAGASSMDRYRNRTPLGRIAAVEEIASAVLFLVSDRASYITGENLRVDGGWVPWGNLEAVGFPEDADRP